MANVNIDDLSEDTTPATGDMIETFDISASANKRVTLTNLFADPPLGAGSVDPEDLVTGAGTSWAWQSWSPTWTNLSVGNGTVTARYVQIGKYVKFRLNLVFGSTTSITGVPTFTLPVTSIALVGADSQVIAVGKYLDSGTAAHTAFVMLASTTTGQLQLEATSGTYGLYQGVTSTTPFTWTNPDEIKFHKAGYEAA